MNVVQLNQYVGNIATALPDVQSYYNQSVYECWNNQEVKYGSFVFAIKNVRPQREVTRFDCVVYYGDRLLEDRSNCSGIQSDAINIIQAVVNSIENSSDNVDIQQPVQCVLFEQKFADELAGAYANLVIETETVGGCGYNSTNSPDYPVNSNIQNIEKTLYNVLYIK